MFHALFRFFIISCNYFLQPDTPDVRTSIPLPDNENSPVTSDDKFPSVTRYSNKGCAARVGQHTADKCYRL
ncbi:hypothetical protein EG028_03045 [Chitinophaga barathri]|uniref:Uncharacterized protein n=1 Tax=Chitinophaga barathri TaxID=1647451 RepID=A0A3N4MI57_9BACT|nr:hypothetical protein EG028_03045 [Chitinophaga barathri]